MTFETDALDKTAEAVVSSVAVDVWVGAALTRAAARTARVSDLNILKAVKKEWMNECESVREYPTNSSFSLPSLYLYHGKP